LTSSEITLIYKWNTLSYSLFLARRVTIKKFFYKIATWILLVVILLWPFDSQASFLWQQVGGMGLGDPDNVVIANMETWNNALYAGVGNYVDGCRIYRSFDGTTWTKVNNDGFGHVNLNVIMDFQSFGGQLFVSTSDDRPIPAQVAEIWRSADGAAWNQSGADGLGHAHNLRFNEMAVFDGQLYVGSFNNTDGGEIYRTADGVNWNLIPATAGGFGDANNRAIWSLYSFGGWLWAGTWNNNGAQIWRSADGANWNLYLDMAGFLPNITAINHFFEFNGLLHWFGIDAVQGASVGRRTTEILTEIFINFTGDPNDIWYSENTVVSGGLLYAGTRNDVSGGALWFSADGINLTQIGLDGFGNVDNFAIYALAFKDYLYIGLSTVNGAKGAEIWRRLITYDFGITNKTLPQGTQGQAYSTQLETTGGTKPYSYRLVKGNLPQGMELSPTGELKGTPQQSGDFQFVVEVQDSFKKVSKTQRVFSLKIVAGASAGVAGITLLPKTGADLY